MESARLVVDTALLVLIWLVQVVIYPSFAKIARTGFAEFHRRYMRLISVFVVPLMLLQVGVHGVVIAELIGGGRMSVLPGVAAGLIVVVWGVTFRLSVPCHRALSSSGNQPEIVRRLVRTNWVRTVAWTVVWAISVAGSIR